MKQLNWYVVNKDYITYLKKFDSRVENIDYGENRVKPYIGIVFSFNNRNYYVPISSSKPKHNSMSEKVDFIKLKNSRDRLIGVINLNNMIPVSNNDVTKLNYNEISKYKNFQSLEEEKKYVSLLRMQLSVINSRIETICSSAKRLYEIKQKMPTSKVAQRCCDFKLLEKKCATWEECIDKQDLV